ncbi:hypothetical protein [Hymenobacter canadensis]|uniref:Uncharacterized protein n=1 Tax=Hymenobacter canadensis TaxID=2999067 RepID=A0ABY7LV74_9BACT|nr:hypothetical protein [Hymenobacter canadensis]WBA44282.1 hypothetical protein O3303_21645 [Hymenobacter canadensis]
MTKSEVIIEFSETVRRVDYCNLEGRDIDTNDFELENGRWKIQLDGFPIENDDDLDLVIVVVGNPGVKCNMTVSIDDVKYGPYDSYKPFNSSGYAQFDFEIPLDGDDTNFAQGYRIV